MAAVMSEKNIWSFILLLIATTFSSWSIILLNKQHLVHWECSICKNGKERPFLNQNNSHIKNALFLKRRAQPSWKFANRYILIYLTPSDNESLAGLLNFDFRILWRKNACLKGKKRWKVFLYLLELSLRNMELHKQAFWQTKATTKKQGVSSI